MSAYQLEKEIWSESDFHRMGWHDSRVWGVFADVEAYEIAFDIDYIFQWVKPKKKGGYFKFWVSPVTMVFSNAYDLKIDIHSTHGNIEISDLSMGEERKTKNNKGNECDYKFECHEGEIELTANGFQMFVRKHPVLQSAQCLDFNERGGICFTRLERET